MTRRFWIGVVARRPRLPADDGRHAVGWSTDASPRRRRRRTGSGSCSRSRWSCGAAVRSSSGCGRRSFNASPNMFTLIGIGTGAAFVYSAVATVVPGAFPASLQVHGGVETYFDTAVVITVLVLLGQVLELRARHRTGGAIRQLLGLAPKTARVVRGGHEEDVPLESVQRGDTLRVRPGEKVPVDGVVVDGAAAVDESMVTGESIPADKAAGRSCHRRDDLRERHAHACAPSEWAARRCWRRSCGWSAMRSARARRSNGSPIGSRAYFVPAVVAGGGGGVRRLEPVGTGAPARARAGECRRGPDHRVPVRARAGDADGHHGRHGAWRAGRRARQERGGARAAGAGRHAGRRQDGHADRGQATRHRARGRRTGATSRTKLLRLAAAVERGSAHPLAAAIVAAADGARPRCSAASRGSCRRRAGASAGSSTGAPSISAPWNS